MSTGLPDLDAKLGGLRPGNVVIIAGRPSMGKTSLGTNIAQAVAIAGTPVAFYSLEMSREELATRILSSRTGISSWDMTTGRVKEFQIAQVMKAQHELAAMALTIDHSGGLTIPQLHASARRLKRQGKLELLVLDYLGLMRGTQAYGGNRTQEVTEITNGLKAIAKELHVPVLALSQINRAVEGRDNKRPQLADLRDSGSIEQDADVVLFCYREEYYVEREKPADGDTDKFTAWAQRLKACTGKAEAILAKNRHGPTGTVELSFDGPTMTFAAPAAA